MVKMFEIILVFLCVGIIVAVVIVAVYVAVCYINKKMGLDSNGKPIQQMQQPQIQYIERESKPQVIKIELSGGGQVKNMDEYMGSTFSNGGITSAEKTEIQMVNLSSDIKQKKVETTFENKRLGKVD